jgi:hypothetical protein
MIMDFAPWELRQLLRDLAMFSEGGKALAAMYNVSVGSLEVCKHRHKREIEEIRLDLENKFAGMWIANKEMRIAAYMAEFENLNESDYRNHHEWSKARQACLKAVAEELGQLPGRANIIVIPVQHIVVGVNTEDLK